MNPRRLAARSSPGIAGSCYCPRPARRSCHDRLLIVRRGPGRPLVSATIWAEITSGSETARSRSSASSVAYDYRVASPRGGSRRGCDAPTSAVASFAGSGHWAELTPEQQAVFDPLITPGPQQRGSLSLGHVDRPAACARQGCDGSAQSTIPSAPAVRPDADLQHLPRLPPNHQLPDYGFRTRTRQFLSSPSRATGV